MITIKELAKIAGVSRGTIDRVVNRRGRVDKSVEARISGIIDKYGYKPNKVARALVNRKKLYVIGAISASVNNVFFRDVVEGVRRAEAEMKEFGVSLRYREVTKFSVPDQLACIDEMLEEGIDALAINPINDEAIRSRLKEVDRRNIPVITFNSDIEGTDRLAYIGCDYRKTGRIAAGLVAVSCREKANIAVVIGSMKSLGHHLRMQGFCDEIKKYSGLKVERVVEMYDDESTSFEKVRELLAEAGEVDAFFFAAGGKEGGLRAIRESREGNWPRIVTVDIDPFTTSCLREGLVFATVCQQPFVQGYEPVKQLAHCLLYGEKPEKAVQYTQAEIVIRQSIS
ncbi:transcriptional regulator [Betaproteobacteria bacterium]|nr:transcriptional regulator [Betaproteobacteria bacterium]